MDGENICVPIIAQMSFKKKFREKQCRTAACSPALKTSWL